MPPCSEPPTTEEDLILNRLQTAGLRYVYALDKGLSTNDTLHQDDVELRGLLESLGLNAADTARVLAADGTVAALPGGEIGPLTATNYNNIVRGLKLTTAAGDPIVWPSEHDRLDEKWSDAVASVGLIASRPSRPIPSAEDVKIVLRRFLEESGQDTSPSAYVAWRKGNNTAPSLAMITRVFKTWGDAIGATGARAENTSQVRQQASNTQDKLEISLEAHRVEAERLRDRMKLAAPPQDELARHTELAYLIAAETHALESSKVNTYLLDERERKQRLFTIGLPIAAVIVAVVQPVLGFILGKLH